LTQQPRIALVGNLANVAYQTCKFLRQKGVRADVFVYEMDLASPPSNPETEDPGILRNPPAWLRIVRQFARSEGDWMHSPLRRLHSSAGNRISNLRLFLMLRRYDVIESFCCAPWFVPFVGRPYIAFATGSDLRELALEDTPKGRHARSIFQHAQIVLFGPDSGHLDAVRQLRLSGSYPCRQIIDTDFYAPNPGWRRQTAEALLIFHPSRLDWTYSGQGHWIKGNDRLFRAFARLVKEGHGARLFYLERGDDIEATRRLVTELGIAQNVDIYSGEMTREQLCHYYNFADVVADQFCIGLGRIGLEAMSCGRPVLVGLDARATDLCYEEVPPVLNCRTEDEIYARLKSALDPEYRERIGREAREWVMKYHRAQRVVDNLIWHFETVLGRGVV
jgi:glycosyltransferase involved in cell wall biosynthesis